MGCSRLIGVLLVMVLGACAAVPVSPSGSPGGDSSPAFSASPSVALDAASAELDHLLQQLESIHPEPWHGVTRAEFVAELEDLKAELGSLTDAQAMVAVMHLVALISRDGRDGHMNALPIDDDGQTALPIRLFEFAEGVFITDAMTPHRDLVATRIVAIGGHAVEDVLEALEPLVPRDGPATVPAFRPLYLLRVQVLEGLGLIGPGAVQLTVRDGPGERTVAVDPVPMDAYRRWAGPGGMVSLPIRADLAWLQQPDRAVGLEELDGGRVQYVRYRMVRSYPVGLPEELRDRAAAPGVERVVVDLRHNGGGDNTTYRPLLSAVRAAGAEPGRLYLLTDRLTFSAAANFVTEVEQTTPVTIVGEPMGGGLNFWDDVTRVELRNLPVPMDVGISVRYWQKSEPDDPRLTIEPQIPVPTRAADYFAGRDPVLEAALAAPS
jgi:hypothetical protein